MTRVRLAYLLALAGHLGLFFLLLGAIARLPADNQPSRFLLLFTLVGPLLFPLRGLLHGRPYTHAWSGFMALVYFVIGIGVAAGEKTLPLGIAITTTATLWFFGALFYVRWKVPKKNETLPP